MDPSAPPLLAAPLALNGADINISRIVGPAPGGLVVEAVAALAINAATFGAVIFAYARLPPTRPEICFPAKRSAELKATHRA
jgi:hypothetical protein